MSTFELLTYANIIFLTEQTILSMKVVICGGGLAGITLALWLIELEHEVKLIDYQTPGNSSRAAAGLINPVTGKRAVFTWNFLEFKKSFERFFSLKSVQGLKTLYTEKEIIRPLYHPGEWNDWSGKTVEPTVSDLVELYEGEIYPGILTKNIGGILIKGGGWLNVSEFLDAGLCVLKTSNRFSYSEGFLKNEDVFPKESVLNFQGNKIKYDYLVFAEGESHISGNFFSIPLQKLKGQIIRLQSDSISLKHIISSSVFLLPTDNGIVCGSTYERQFTDAFPDEAGLNYLKGQAEKVLNKSFKIISHWSGIRPGSPDRKPIVGRHNEYPQLLIMNGLGTKGVLQAPFCAEIICNMIENPDYLIPAEINSNRFIK